MTSSYYKRIDSMNIRGTNLAACRFEVRCRAMAYGLDSFAERFRNLIVEKVAKI